MRNAAELERERRTLARSERDIIQGERRIACQERLVETLRHGGRDVVAAEVLLAELRGTLAVWRSHRVEVLRRIDYLQQGVPNHG